MFCCLATNAQCRILWCSFSKPFEPLDLDRATARVVHGHGYEKNTKGRTYWFKEKAPPRTELKKLVLVRLWEQPSIAPQRYSEMTDYVLAVPCGWDISIPSKHHINAKLIEWLIDRLMKVQISQGRLHKNTSTWNHTKLEITRTSVVYRQMQGIA